MSSDEVDQAMREVVASHNAVYHPGRQCTANTMGQCADAFGVTPPQTWPNLPAGPADAVAPHLDVYLVVNGDNDAGLITLDRDRAHQVARDSRGVVARLPVVGDYRETGGTP